MNLEKERLWQAKWKELGIATFHESDIKRKLYVMEMFSYPSGAKLHLGHWFNFGLVDSWARFKRLQGYAVFQPMGFDAFGLPAENYAIKTGVHPKDSTYHNITVMKRQLDDMGGMFDWSKEIITCDPEYYKWTQWVFLQLYKMGLAYKKSAPANWCPSCKTVLAREQVKDGCCERCGTEVHTKKMSQWFLKITDYAEELIEGLNNLDWPEKTKAMQRAWIGKTEGSKIIFKTETGKELEVFTDKPEMVFGSTALLIAPEHGALEDIVTEEFKEDVNVYVKQAEYLTEIERQSTKHEKTGVFTGSFAINPVTGKKIPIWVADYIIESYGTGIAMAVPAHDEKDFEFAKKHDLEIIPVISNGNDSEKVYIGKDGMMINSDFLNGMTAAQAKETINTFLEQKNCGGKAISYRLRDWLISRQRYWGAPIPIIYCDDCGIVPVPEKDLPVELPYDVEFSPTGESPLAKCREFVETTCPCCGKKARREVDTMDTFMCSSWYQLRYPDARNSKKAFDKDIVNKMLPVDMYVGGAEHSCMHLIYSRFVTKALRDAGYLDINEPFQRLIHQGMILGTDGQKMSKSKGNTVSPDEYVEKYGSDVFRTYLMFGFKYTEGGPWSDSGLEAINKYFKRIDRYYNRYFSIKEFSDLYGKEEADLEKFVNIAIDKITIDFEAFQFNTAIAKMMELSNQIGRYLDTGRNSKVLTSVMEILACLMAPSAPHTAEEYWQKLGHSQSIFITGHWPKADKDKMASDKIEIPVQMNGKTIAKIEIDPNATQSEAEAIAQEYVTHKLNGKTIQRVVYVSRRIINFVAR